MSDRQIASTRRLEMKLANAALMVKAPLTMLPARLQEPAFALWSCHRFLKDFESPLSLAGMFSVWISRFGLREDDAEVIIWEQMDPHRVREVKFTSDLTSSLASAVAEATDRRKAEAKIERDRKAADEAKAKAAGPEQMEAFKAELRKRGSIVSPVPQADPEAVARSEEFARQNR